MPIFSSVLAMDTLKLDNPRDEKSALNGKGIARVDDLQREWLDRCGEEQAAFSLGRCPLVHIAMVVRAEKAGYGAIKQAGIALSVCRVSGVDGKKTQVFWALR